MEELTRFVWGTLGLLFLALALVLASAGALQGWHDLRQAAPSGSATVARDPLTGEPGTATSSYWYGREPAALKDDRRS